MRPIDADALLEKVEKIHPWEPYPSKYAQGIRHCMGLVSLLIQNAPPVEPSAQPETDWIPVTKKAHPDLPIRVQVQMDNGWIITAYYQEGEWLSVPDCGESLQDKWIEAWRELPEPYAERRGDG